MTVSEFSTPSDTDANPPQTGPGQGKTPQRADPLQAQPAQDPGGDAGEVPAKEGTADRAAIMAKRIYRLYREFFDLAERKRRWSLQDDIPWHQCNPSLNPAIADVVESFCAV